MRRYYSSVQTLKGHQRCCRVIEKQIANMTGDTNVRHVAYNLAVAWFNSTGGDWAPGDAVLRECVANAEGMCKLTRALRTVTAGGNK